MRDYLAEGERARLAAEGAQSEEPEPPPLASHPRLTQKRSSLTTGLLSHTGGSNSWQAGTGKQTAPHRNSFCSSRPRLPNKPQLSAAGVVHSSAATSGSGSGSGSSGGPAFQMGANANSLGSNASSTSVSVPYQRGRSSSLVEQTINKMSKVSIVRRSVSTKSGLPPLPSPSPSPASKTATAAAAKTSGKLKTSKSSSSERKLSQ